MSDTRAAIRELRSLGEKRSTQGLTEQEQSRLAELRERLGLPSEPADGRSGAPRPGGALPAAAPAPPRAAPNVPTPSMPPPPAGAVALPRLEGPAGPAPLPSFANLAPAQPAVQPEPARALTGALPVLDQGAPDAVVDSGGALADLDAAASATVEPLPEGGAVLEHESSQWPSEPGFDALAPTVEAADAQLETNLGLAELPEGASDSLGAMLQPADGAFDPSPTLPELAPDDLGSQPADGAFDPSPTLPELAPDHLGAQPADGAFDAPATLPELAPDDLGAQPAEGTFDASPTLPELAPDDLGVQPAEGAFDASATLPEFAPDDLGVLPAEGAFDAPATLPELAPDDLGVQPTEGAFDASATLPEFAPDDLGVLPAEGAFDASATVPELAPDDLGAIPQGDAALEPGQALTDSAAALPAEHADGAEPLTGANPNDAPEASTSTALTAESPTGEPPPAPHRSSLAERINAVVGPPDGQSWGATREPILLEETMQADPGPEAGQDTFSPSDLGAIPLDVADPATEASFGDPPAPIELSSADVMLLEGEPTPDPELAGEPADPVPLAALHEFVGEQPFDPRALAFDDEGDEPGLVPEDLVGTGAELASAADAFHPGGDELPPEPEPAPAPAAPRIAVPRPPPGPPPSRPAPVPTTRAPPVPPTPPPEAVGAGAEVRKVPTISAAQPESPQGGFGRSGPFARPPAVLMGPARLDVMDEGTDESLGIQEPAASPPVTDVATGAEVFGGAYLNPTFVEGEHRVVLHTLEGQVRRGTVKDLDLLDAVIRLAQPGRAPEAIAAERVKAIFFMQEPGATPLPSSGRRIRVGFSDGRQIVGFSDDVDSGEQGFFLVPADTRTHTARIYVFRAGVQSISAA